MTRLYNYGDVIVTATFVPSADNWRGDAEPEFWTLDAEYKGVEVERTTTFADDPSDAAKAFGEKIRNWKESPKPVLTLVDYDPFAEALA